MVLYGKDFVCILSMFLVGWDGRNFKEAQDSGCVIVSAWLLSTITTLPLKTFPNEKSTFTVHLMHVPQKSLIYLSYQELNSFFSSTHEPLLLWYSRYFQEKPNCLLKYLLGEPQIDVMVTGIIKAQGIVEITTSVLFLSAVCHLHS